MVLITYTLTQMLLRCA